MWLGEMYISVNLLKKRRRRNPKCKAIETPVTSPLSCLNSRLCVFSDVWRSTNLIFLFYFGENKKAGVQLMEPGYCKTNANVTCS